MVKITHHSFRGTCEVCGSKIGAESRRKKNHYAQSHPQIKFNIRRLKEKKKTMYACGLCSNLNSASNYAMIVEHYKKWHKELLNGPVFVEKAEKGKKEAVSPSPAPKPPSDPIEHVNSFFESLTGLMLEVERLRQEKQAWMETAAKWSRKIVELQELLGKKP